MCRTNWWARHMGRTERLQTKCTVHTGLPQMHWLCKEKRCSALGTWVTLGGCQLSVSITQFCNSRTGFARRTTRCARHVDRTMRYTYIFGTIVLDLQGETKRCVRHVGRCQLDASCMRIYSSCTGFDIRRGHVLQTWPGYPVMATLRTWFPWFLRPSIHL